MVSSGGLGGGVVGDCIGEVGNGLVGSGVGGIGDGIEGDCVDDVGEGVVGCGAGALTTAS